jgi:hypothetical protein
MPSEAEVMAAARAINSFRYRAETPTTTEIARAALEAAERVREPRLEKRPVAWRVNCFIFHDEAAAYKEHEATGAPMQGLYVRDGT